VTAFKKLTPLNWLIKKEKTAPELLFSLPLLLKHFFHTASLVLALTFPDHNDLGLFLPRLYS
jgi:hypothetical protein